MAGKPRNLRFETIQVHGLDAGRAERGAMPGPVYFATAYEHESAGTMAEVFLGQQAGHLYSRLQNPTVEAYERRISELCGARGTLAVASGMTAISITLMALLRPGDEVLAGQYLFGGTYTLFNRTLRDLGVVPHFFDPRRPKQAAELVTPRTRLVFLECIANPAMVVPDFRAYRRLCDQHGLPLLADATLLTPYLLDSAALGVDLAFLSASKHLGGGAVSMGGLVVDTGRSDWSRYAGLNLGDYRRQGEHALLAKLRGQMMADMGPNLAPMSAFMQMLGLESLSLRMAQQCGNALEVARFLAAHRAVVQVSYPGLPRDEFHQVAKRQYRGMYGSLLAFRLEDRAACFGFLDRLRLIKRATNLGDTRSIAIHPASTIYATLWKPEQEQLGISEDLIRLSIGIEHAEDLKDDLAQALG